MLLTILKVIFLVFGIPIFIAVIVAILINYDQDKFYLK